MKNERGFSLVQVLVAVGLMGGLSLLLMRFSNQATQIKNMASTNHHEIELKHLTREILKNENNCKVSFESTPQFYKRNHNQESNGINVSLYLSSQDGTSRTLKQLNGKNNIGTLDKSVYESLSIEELRLVFDNPTGNSNQDYAPAASHSDLVNLLVYAKKKVSKTQTRDIKFRVPLNLYLSTDASRRTSITGCSASSGSSTSTPESCETRSISPWPITNAANISCQDGEYMKSFTGLTWGNDLQVISQFVCCKR